jgi:hypothetical protein
MFSGLNNDAWSYFFLRKIGGGGVSIISLFESTL